MGYGSFGIGYIPKPGKLQIIDGTATLDEDGVIQVVTSKAVDNLTLVKFIAPCNSEEVEGIAFNGGETFDIMDTSNRSILGLSGYFARDAAVAVLISSAGEVAYIQGGSSLAGSLITITFDGGFSGQKYTVTGGGETYTGVIPDSNVVNQWVIPINCTYTITATTADGQSWSNTVEAGAWFTWYHVTIQGYIITLDATPAQSGSLTYNGLEQTAAFSNYDPNQLQIGGTYKATNAGTYTATFTPRYGYEWEDGTSDAVSVQWTIGKAEGLLSINPTSMTLTNEQPTGIIAVTRPGTGTITAQSSDSDVASVSVSGNKVTVTGGDQGTANITISVAADNNYTAPESKACIVSVQIVPVGQKWTYASNATFTVPATGDYQVELHGGGGGGGGGGGCDGSGGSWSTGGSGGGGGGGSGDVDTFALTVNSMYSIVIGKGGDGGAAYYNNRQKGEDGGTSRFGNLMSVSGGSGGTPGYNDIYGNDVGIGGAGAGSTGEDGENGTESGLGSAGRGGNGGSGGGTGSYGRGGNGGTGGFSISGQVGGYTGLDGYDGACIITFLG